MKPFRKKERLQKRISAFNTFMSRQSEYKVGQRKQSGGYRCPGSYSR